MATDAKKKSFYPPLHCEQLEDRQVLSVTVGPTSAVPTGIVHSHLGPTTATNFVIMQPVIQLGATGSSTPVSPQGGSATSAATSATAGTSAVTGTGATNAATSGSSASGAASAGGPLFTPGGMPVIYMGSINPQMFDAPVPGDSPSAILSMVSAASGAHTGSVSVATQPPTPAPTDPSTPAPSYTSVAENVAGFHPTEPSSFLAPTTAVPAIASTTETIAQPTTDLTTTLSSTTLAHLSTTTTPSTTTGKDSDEAVIVHTATTTTEQSPDDPLINPNVLDPVR